MLYNERSFQKSRPRGPIIALIIGVCALLVVGIFFFIQSLPITITLNGTSQEIRGAKSLESLVEQQLVSPKPGNFVAIDGSVIAENEGELMHARVNDQITTDYKASLSNGDVVEVKNGEDIVETFHEQEATIDFATQSTGVGPLTILQTQGAPGKGIERIGDSSNISLVEETEPATDQVFLKYRPNVGNDWVVALTFDDGPWGSHTSEILDILNEHKVKATFFVVGEVIHGDGVDLVKRMHDEGHQVATHTYSHARGEGGSVDMGRMSPEAQIEEVTKGYESIKSATGVEPSHVLRTPGGNYSTDTMRILEPYVDAEIGWTIDTEDWRKPGGEVVERHMMDVKPGSIVLAHDGGGDRSNTVEGLKRALPRLKEAGFTFITIDQMLEYPPA